MPAASGRRAEWCWRSSDIPEDLFVVQVDALLHDAHGAVAAHDLLDGCLFVLEHLIHFKEVHHFFKDVVRQLRDVGVEVVRRLAEGDGDDLFVHLTVVDHVDDADRVALHQRGGQNGLAAQYEHVERVAVVGEGARDKPVAGGVHRRGVQHAVQPQYARRLVQLVLALRALLDLDIAHKVFRLDARGVDVVPDIHIHFPPFSNILPQNGARCNTYLKISAVNVQTALLRCLF